MIKISEAALQEALKKIIFENQLDSSDVNRRLANSDVEVSTIPDELPITASERMAVQLDTETPPVEDENWKPKNQVALGNALKVLSQTVPTDDIEMAYDNVKAALKNKQGTNPNEIQGKIFEFFDKLDEAVSDRPRPSQRPGMSQATARRKSDDLRAYIRNRDDRAENIKDMIAADREDYPDADHDTSPVIGSPFEIAGMTNINPLVNKEIHKIIKAKTKNKFIPADARVISALVKNGRITQEESDSFYRYIMSMPASEWIDSFVKNIQKARSDSSLNVWEDIVKYPGVDITDDEISKSKSRKAKDFTFTDASESLGFAAKSASGVTRSYVSQLNSVFVGRQELMDENLMDDIRDQCAEIFFNFVKNAVDNDSSPEFELFDTMLDEEGFTELRELFENEDEMSEGVRYKLDNLMIFRSFQGAIFYDVLNTFMEKTKYTSPAPKGSDFGPGPRTIMQSFWNESPWHEPSRSPAEAKELQIMKEEEVLRPEFQDKFDLMEENGYQRMMAGAIVLAREEYDFEELGKYDNPFMQSVVRVAPNRYSIHDIIGKIHGVTNGKDVPQSQEEIEMGQRLKGSERQAKQNKKQQDDALERARLNKKAEREKAQKQNIKK